MSILPLLIAALTIAVSAPPAPLPFPADDRPALPDTAGFRAELAAFDELTPATREAQASRAEQVVQDWVPGFRVADGEVKMNLIWALHSQSFQLIRTRFAVMATQDINLVSALIAECEDGLAADPTNVTLRALLGYVHGKTGRPREAVNELEKALLAAAHQPPGDDPDAVTKADYLEETALVGLCYAYRNLGRLDRAEALADTLLAREPGSWVRLLKGLCIAGSGRTSEAISYAVRMKPMEFTRENARSGGHTPFPSKFANEWIKSQALLTEGDPAAAVHVLGDIERRTMQRNLPLKDRFWQDVGLAAELAGDEQTGLYYGMAGSGALLRWVHPSEDAATEPVVLGFPSRRTPYFITPEGGFRGGSPFGYLAEQLRVMGDGDDVAAVETARVRALDVCSGLLGRHIRPDLVAGFRARVYLAAGQDDLARADLEYAHAGFARRGEVDPGTSLLLGHLELIAGHDERSGELFQEAVDGMPDNALAWREMGVAMARTHRFDLARRALDRALELEPNAKEGWYNLGVMLYRTGKNDEALAALEKAYTLDNSDERISSMLQVVATARRTAAAAP